MNYQNNNGSKNTKLSFVETLRAANRLPVFRNGAAMALVGIAAVAASVLFTSNNVKMIVGIIGAIISFSGFDQISKAIVYIQNAPAGTDSSNND